MNRFASRKLFNECRSSYAFCLGNNIRANVIIIQDSSHFWVRWRALFGRKEQQSDEAVSWCIIERSNQIFRAQLQHVGRGKFKILNDNQERIHVGQIVDASDILNCERN